MGVRLYSAPVEEQWASVAAPWLRESALTAWKDPAPTVILTPSRAESFYLRGRLVEEGVPFLGLRFWTPSDARKFLLGELPSAPVPATQAELRLLARTCAEQVSQAAAGDNATLASVAREPGAFLRAYDLLLGAGWDPTREGAVYGRDLSRAVQQELESLRLSTQAGLHRELGRPAALRERAVIARVLVIGFNATHWPLWDLLKAVAFGAEQAVVVLSEPRVFAQEIDQLWIGSWEEITQTESIPPTGPISPIGPSPPVHPAPFAPLIASYEKGESARAGAPQLTLLVTSDMASQISAVVLRALDYLRRDGCTRLGIVFPEANALALGVADELRRLGFPLDDGIGSLAPGIFEKRCWQTWIALQEEPGVQRMIAWLRACEVQGVSSGIEPPTSAREIAHVLESALGESLVDDLGFLARHLEHKADSGGTRHGVVADFLRGRIALPEAAPFAEFLGLTRRAFELPGWRDYLARLQIDPPAWLRNLDRMLSRRAFLEWLKESTASQIRTRGAEGNHFYGKIHLLVYAQMSGQTWSHLILTGLNEGVWPRVFETGAFGSRHDLMVLNRQARDLNRLGTTQGGQGMGHETVRADHGHCLLPLERQELALRDLCTALENTTVAASLAAMTADAGRSLLPSDFFSHAYQSLTNRALDEEAFRSLAASTEAWCRGYEPLLSAVAEGIAPAGPSHGERRPPVEIIHATTRIAFEARRDSSQPFGPYEFAFAQPPAQPIQLFCKRWEDAWNHPAAVWLEEIVGVVAWPEGKLSWPRAVGTWVHRWLATALRNCRERNSVAEFPVLLWAAADREAAAVRSRARSAGLELYPWWEQVWAQARAIALGLGETLAPALAEKQFLCEVRLPGDIIALPGTAHSDFVLRGRIDLLLLEPGASSSDFEEGDYSGCACWVIDFKTGAAQSLSAKRIDAGKGLQTLLYALAVCANGARSTAISLHTRDAFLEPQVQLEDILGSTPLFRSLDKFHRDGIFGMRPDAANAYGYSPSYPMATRFIPREILEAKWALVHGESIPEPMEISE